MKLTIDVDGKPYHMVMGVCNLVFLNLLFIAFSIPVITIGASGVALMTVIRTMVDGKSVNPWRDFFAAFQKNFQQSTLCTLIYLVIAAGLYVGFRVVQANSEGIPMVFRVGQILFAAVLVFVASYTFPIISRFDNTLIRTIKNAAVLSVVHPFISILVGAMDVFPLWLLLYASYDFLKTSLFWFLLGFSVIALIQTVLFNRIFLKFIANTQ